MSVARRWIGVALAAPLLAAPLFVAACGDSTKVRVSSNKRDGSNATFAVRDSNRTLGPGDVRIMNVDSSFELAVIGDSIVTGFGPKTLAEIKKGTDTANVTGDGFGASIEKFVKNTVAGALNREIKYSVTDVQDVRFENGKLEFYWKDGSRMKLFENAKQSDKPMSSTFSEADAQRFVAAFHARKNGRA